LYIGKSEALSPHTHTHTHSRVRWNGQTVGHYRHTDGYGHSGIHMSCPG